MYQVLLLADTCNLVPDNMADVDTPVVLDNTGEKRVQFYCSLAFLRNTIYIDNSNPTCLCVVTVILKKIFAKIFFYSLKIRTSNWFQKNCFTLSQFHTICLLFESFLYNYSINFSRTEYNFNEIFFQKKRSTKTC